MEDLSTLFPASSSEGLGDDLIALLGLSPSGGLGELADVDPLKQEPTGLATQPATFPIGPAPAIPKIELTPSWCLPAQPSSRGGATSGAAMSVAESGQSAGEGEGSDDSQDESTQVGHSSGPKRRRRVRNAKQQELNRLAQQRYRMRKKQRQQDLQVTVDELGTQLAQLRAKDEEIKELRKEKLTLERTVLAQEAMLHTANAQLSSQARIIVEQERAMVEQKAAADKAKIDPAVLTEQLAAVLKEALAEMGETVDKQAVDKLTDKLRDKLLARSLSSSCRDARTLAALPKAPAEKPTPSITVSCC